MCLMWSSWACIALTGVLHGDANDKCHFLAFWFSSEMESWWLTKVLWEMPMTKHIRCQENNFSWWATYGENGLLVQTSKGWKNRGEKETKAWALVFIVSVLCNPRVKTVRLAVIYSGLHTSSWIPSVFPMCPPWEQVLCAAVTACRWF